MGAQERTSNKEIVSDAEFQDALVKEIIQRREKAGARNNRIPREIDVLNQQYLDLEHEFHIALTVEARRFKDVKEGFVATELTKSKHALAWAQRKENASSSLIKGLNCMVKALKSKLAEVSKLEQETAAN